MGSKPKNISASRGAGVLGLSKWTTPTEVWLQIMEDREPGFCAGNNFELPEFQESAALRWGLGFEDKVIDLSEKKQNQHIESREKEFDVLNGIITCHVDGIYRDGGALHEGKTTNIRSYRNDWGEPGTDAIPRQYMVQVQHQMMCTNIRKCILSVLVFPVMQDEYEQDGIHVDAVNKESWGDILDEMGFFHQYEIYADITLHRTMAEAYLDWWNDHVIGKTQPKPQAYSDIKKIIRAPSGTIVADPHIEKLSMEYKAITQEIRAVNKRKDDLKTEILSRMKTLISSNDEENADRWVLVSPNGKKLHSYNGKMFR